MPIEEKMPIVLLPKKKFPINIGSKYLGIKVVSNK